MVESFPGMTRGWSEEVLISQDKLWISTRPHLRQITRCGELCPNEHRCSDSSCVFKHKSRPLGKHAILPQRASASRDLMSTMRGCFGAMVHFIVLSQMCMGYVYEKKERRKGAYWTLDKHSF